MPDEKLRVLFVPGNPSHVRTQAPVAKELQRRGHSVCFLVRDRVIRPEYRTGKHLDAHKFATREYDAYYQSDVGRRLPPLGPYSRTRRALFSFLASIEFDVAVLCNDDAALFDRLVVDYSRRNDRDVLLIQESVRPDHRRLPFVTQLKYGGLSAVTSKVIRVVGRYLSRGHFARRGYGHSDCTMIATAGDRFRRQLIHDGVAASKIRVTGQPRLDQPPKDKPSAATDTPAGEAVLLFCNQPLHGPRDLENGLFRDLVAACDACDGVRLLVKLHPRDRAVEHWLGLLSSGCGKSILEVTRTRPLDECFRMADAMMTVASTTSLEAMTAGVPVGLVNYLPTAWYLPYEQSGAALSVDSSGALRESIERLLFDSQLRNKLVSNAGGVLNDELYLQDGQSADRIVDFIEERTSQRTREPANVLDS